MPNYESLIAYCGLYCGDCKIRKNEIADLAKQLMDKLDESHFEREATGLAQMVDEMKALAHYGEFHDVLCVPWTSIDAHPHANKVVEQKPVLLESAAWKRESRDAGSAQNPSNARLLPG